VFGSSGVPIIVLSTHGASGQGRTTTTEATDARSSQSCGRSADCDFEEAALNATSRMVQW
jgi:hypothetical protein